MRELRFERTFVPPYLGDDGIAVGCCAYALYGDKGLSSESPPPLWDKPLSPYLGPMPTDVEIPARLQLGQPPGSREVVPDEGERVEQIVDELTSGGIVALYDGRSELGLRALGHRSILDTRRPACLAEEATTWFRLGEGAEAWAGDVSPYMSVTAAVWEERRDEIPAVTHVDGSSRLQTVTEEAEPRYHRLIKAFFEKTGVPIVLNTSFNTLKAGQSWSLLGTPPCHSTQKQADVTKLLGQARKGGATTPSSLPKRAGTVHYKSTFSAGLGKLGDDNDVRMPDRPMHDERNGGWFELLDDLEGQILGVADGTVGVDEIMAQFTADDDFEDITGADRFLLENVIQRIVRLYEQTFISW
ncbi:hypothetical protein ACHAWF_016293 [Thalassiosira exigua]